jgi:formate hydrogenlyase subunit 6/NADH:ubiquinone oxidoreductase subunit I
MADSKELVLGRELKVSVDRVALREAISRLQKPGGNQEWCIACGAGKDAGPADKLDWVQNQGAQLLQGKNLREFIDSLKDIGPQAWCIACGAGKDASPMDSIINPAEVSDDIIDLVAQKLLTAVKLG